MRNDFVCLFVLSNKFLSRYQVQLGFSQQPRGYLFDWTSGEVSTWSQFHKIGRIKRNSLGSGAKWHHEAANNSTWWANWSICCAYISLSRWTCLQSLDYRSSHFFLRCCMYCMNMLRVMLSSKLLAKKRSVSCYLKCKNRSLIFLDSES